MKVQNIYTVEDYSPCLNGHGEIITKCLRELFSNVAFQVMNIREPVDWLVVKSSSLSDITFCSQNMFEDRLESTLREHDKRISVVRYHTQSHGGAISEKSIERWIRESLKQEKVPLRYLNPPKLGLNFVGYHLDMPR